MEQKYSTNKTTRLCFHELFNLDLKRDSLLLEKKDDYKK